MSFFSLCSKIILILKILCFFVRVVVKFLLRALIYLLGLCFRDAEWNGAFNFTGKLDFLTNCIKQTKGKHF